MDIEQRCEISIEANNVIIEKFEQNLINQKLSPKTIRTHVMNVHFFLNSYVAPFKGDNYLVADQYIDDFLGYYFIRKCMWSTPAAIKTYITSLKKFYAFLLAEELITQSKYKEIVDFMKMNKEFWLEDCADFNDPSYDYFGMY